MKLVLTIISILLLFHPSLQQNNNSSSNQNIILELNKIQDDTNSIKCLDGSTPGYYAKLNN